jgi:glycosyltransferase 2 family protein
MSKFFSILFYLSILFVLIFLYKFDYFIFPSINNYYYLFISIILITSSYYFRVVGWKDCLKITGIDISLKRAIVSTGLSVFMAYIPGKLMVVVGRAAYVSNKNKVSISNTSSTSFFNQVLHLWTGLLIGSIALISTNIPPTWNILTLITFTALTLIILFQKRVFVLLKKLASYFKKNLNLPSIDNRNVYKILPSFFLLWLSWGLGFLFLVKSVYVAEAVPIQTIFAFPLSATLGIVAIFAPGGIGVREAVLVGCLTLYQIPIEIATGITVLSRVWFIIGEAFIFITSIVLKKFDNE